MNAAALGARLQDRLVDMQPGPSQILADVVAGLSREPKCLPSKYFYDARGSELFEAITHLPEYYLTRVETALLAQRMKEIAALIGPRVQVVEYGSGSGRKTELLLDGLEHPAAYTPIEISASALLASVTRLAACFPGTEMLPVCADFCRAVPVPPPGCRPDRRLAFFPGSTLGNFEHDEAVRLLAAMRQTVGHGGAALIGIDLDKDPALIEAAYNDAQGVTREFTLNLLRRLNRDVGSDFVLDRFRHRARYARERLRIETALVSAQAQQVAVGGRCFHFQAGEAMPVEISQKYTDASFAALAHQAGWAVAAGWNDPAHWFGLRLLRPVAG